MQARRPAFLALLVGAWLLVPAGSKGADPSAFSASGLIQRSRPSEGDELFAATSPLKITLEISPAGIETLRGFRPANTAAKPTAEATVSEGGRQYAAVSTHLKGFSSFQPIDQRPSLTLNFDKVVAGQTFHGLDKISLNNSSQDPTRLHEPFARELFAAAGVPVPRAGYALVTLNGRDLGLYVLTEGFDKRFIERHFARTDGNLYEGGFLQDITADLELDSGKNPESEAAVQRLIAAAREPDPDQRFRALAATLDLDRFISMVAIETMLCHSDSYSMNRNNYRLYHDPATNKIVFMPHGMDRILGGHRSALDLSLVPPRLGLVARALLSTAEGRRRYVERVSVLLKTIFQPEPLCRRASALGARVNATQEAADLCARVSTRAANVQFQLGDAADLRQVTPALAFDAGGTSRITGWRPAPKAGQPPVSFTSGKQDGRDVLHLSTKASSLVGSLRTRVALPAGRYQLTGHVLAFGNGQSSDPVAATLSMVRIAPGRWDYDRRQWGSQVTYGFQVSPTVSPEEIELTVEVSAKAQSVWIDASSLALVRVGD